MLQQLYKDEAQARRITVAAQQALATTSAGAQEAPLIIPAEAWASALCILSTSMQQQHQELRRQRERKLGSLRHQASALVERPCRNAGIPIQVLGEYPLFSGLKLVHGTLSDVVIVPAEDDPLLAQGRFPLPHKVQQRLRAMEKAGVDFTHLHTYIAHEVLVGSVNESGPLPLEAVIPPAAAQSVRTSELFSSIAHIATSTVLGGLGLAAKGVAHSALYASLSTGMAATLLLDPLIFGAFADERGMATWFVLAQ